MTDGKIVVIDAQNRPEGRFDQHRFDNPLPIEGDEPYPDISEEELAWQLAQLAEQKRLRNAG